MTPRSRPRLSVVICTYNRAARLAELLGSLRGQTYPEFEVIVVNGPSSDNTDAVLANHAGAVRAGACAECNISASRNVGIAMAAGEIVAFIDDDAVPEPSWLEALVAPYGNIDVAGAGGPVEDGRTGERLYGVCVTTRAGEVAFDRIYSKGLVQPNADPMLYLPGGNMSFRRDIIVAAGGFDEHYAYGYDDVDLCARLIDAGKMLVVVPEAVVSHYPAANSVRDEEGIFRDIYPVMMARRQFALRGVSDADVRAVVLAELEAWRVSWRHLAHDYLQRGIFYQAEHDRFVQRLADALTDDLALGASPPVTRQFEAGTRDFLPFPVRRLDPV
jgi:glycogen(starch) synthase